MAQPQQILQAVPTVIELPDGAGIQPLKDDSLEGAGFSSSPATAAPAHTLGVNEGAGPSRPRPIQAEESTTVDLTQDGKRLSIHCPTSSILWLFLTSPLCFIDG